MKGVIEKVRHENHFDTFTHKKSSALVFLACFVIVKHFSYPNTELRERVKSALGVDLGAEEKNVAVNLVLGHRKGSNRLDF